MGQDFLPTRPKELDATFEVVTPETRFWKSFKVNIQ